MSWDIRRGGGVERPDPLSRPVLLVAMVPCWQPIVPFGHGSSLLFLYAGPATEWSRQQRSVIPTTYAFQKTLAEALITKQYPQSSEYITKIERVGRAQPCDVPTVHDVSGLFHYHNFVPICVLVAIKKDLLMIDGTITHPAFFPPPQWRRARRSSNSNGTSR
jgi:hypothetical protein